MEPHGLLTGLPADYALVHFHHFEQIQRAAKEVLETLAEKEDGNQYVVVLGLSETARQRLDSGEDCLDGISFRFMWENNTGLVKVIPTAEHESVTDTFRGEIEFICRSQMGIPRDEILFGVATTHQPTVGNKGKQPDQCFWPPSRQPGPGQRHGWPTLVIETGVTESLQRLRDDAYWWFNNSLGDVRIVLLFCISRRQRKIIVEKWHLAPPDTPNPMTRSMINQLVISQRPPLEQPYLAQEIVIDPVSVHNAPLVLNFEAIFDRGRQQNESDIVFNATDLRHCTRIV